LTSGGKEFWISETAAGRFKNRSDSPSDMISTIVLANQPGIGAEALDRMIQDCRAVEVDTKAILLDIETPEDDQDLCAVPWL